MWLLGVWSTLCACGGTKYHSASILTQPPVTISPSSSSRLSPSLLDSLLLPPTLNIPVVDPRHAHLRRNALVPSEGKIRSCLCGELEGERNGFLVAFSSDMRSDDSNTKIRPILRSRFALPALPNPHSPSSAQTLRLLPSRSEAQWPHRTSTGA